MEDQMAARDLAPNADAATRPDGPALIVGEWKKGLPPGDYYPGMERDFEVYFSPGGMKWHRRIAQ